MIRASSQVARLGNESNPIKRISTSSARATSVPRLFLPLRAEQARGALVRGRPRLVVVSDAADSAQSVSGAAPAVVSLPASVP
jgi:hypothetical protein